jgi:murein L,D-transpeptidase YcbB/YkuD
MQSGKEIYVTLKNTIPVYIGYFTAFVASDGTMQFRDDIYNRDERLLKLITQ